MKFKEITKLSKKEIEEKFNDLKIELIKARASKTNSKVKQIKKIIARINTFNNSKKEGVEKK